MVKKPFKYTHVGRLPEDWDCLQAIEVIDEISMGPFGSDITVSNFVSSGVPVLNGYNVSQIMLIDKFQNFVTPKKAKELKKAVAHRGDIIVTHRGTIGQVSYIPDSSAYSEYVISQSQFRVHFNDKRVNSHFLVSYLLSPIGQKYLLETKGHTGVPALAQPTTNFRRLWIPLPEIAEQVAIAEALSNVDSLISSLQKLIEKKKAIKQGAMQELLTGKKRLPGFSGEWSNLRIEEITNLHDNLRVPVEKSMRKKGNIPYYGANGIQDYVNGYTHNGSYVLIAEDGANDLQEYPIRYASGKMWVNNHVHVLDSKNSVSDTRFLSYSMSTIDYQAAITGGTRAKLNGHILMQLALDLPPLAEQQAIAQVLSDMDSEIEQLKKKLSKYQQIKQGMMQELLTGRIRLKKGEMNV